MFTLPPRPPTDYVLTEVPPNQASGPEFTPDAAPRITLPTVGQYCFPLESAPEDAVGEIKIETVKPIILDKWTKQARALWVDKPEENAPYIHEMCKNYSVVVDPDYSPTYKHRPKVFQRSYKYELDCIEEKRLRLLDAKCKQELLELDMKQKKRQLRKEEDTKKAFIVPCRELPPFWWKENEIGRSSYEIASGSVEPLHETTTYRTSYLRWQKQPNFLNTLINDPCKRRAQLLLVGQNFRHEAITWYNENYPQRKLKFRPEKFSQ